MTTRMIESLYGVPSRDLMGDTLWALDCKIIHMACRLGHQSHQVNLLVGIRFSSIQHFCQVIVWNASKVVSWGEARGGFPKQSQVSPACREA